MFSAAPYENGICQNNKARVKRGNRLERAFVLQGGVRGFLRRKGGDAWKGHRQLIHPAG
jgi:hypothetical protein